MARNCPFCGGPVTHQDGAMEAHTIEHRAGCWLRDKRVLWSDEIDAWNVREPDWEQRWGELVETTGRRISESVKSIRLDEEEK